MPFCENMLHVNVEDENLIKSWGNAHSKTVT